MEDTSKLVRIYSGSGILTSLLKDELESSGIAALIKNEFQSGIISGFSGGAPSSLDLYIQESDVEKAVPIVNEFRAING